MLTRAHQNTAVPEPPRMTPKPASSASMCKVGAMVGAIVGAMVGVFVRLKGTAAVPLFTTGPKISYTNQVIDRFEAVDDG